MGEQMAACWAAQMDELLAKRLVVTMATKMVVQWAAHLAGSTALPKVALTVGHLVVLSDVRLAARTAVHWATLLAETMAT